MNYTNCKSLILTFLFYFAFYTYSFSQCPVLIWSDEFNDTGLPNSEYWSYDLGQSGWGNQEIQNYTNNLNNIRQEDGRLIIDAFKTGTTWTSARIKTQNKVSVKYGRIVFRAKLPTGVGTWPALWMLGDNFPTVGWPACGEIDIMEHVGRNQNVIQAALHNPSSFGNTQNKGSITINTASTEFHEYAVSWNKDRMIFYVDNTPYYTYSPANKTAANWPYDAGHFIIMNLAMGGTFGGPVDPNLSAARMEIDYVRVYEERSEPIIEGAKFVFENQKAITYTAPDYGNDIVYNWVVPNGVSIVSGQGSNIITVDWGENDGLIYLYIEGETGCSSNATSIQVTTIVNPVGLKFTAEDFSVEELTGWTKNDNAISLAKTDNMLHVTYNLSSLKHIQYEMPKAVNLSDYGILKVRISASASSPLPKLLLTLRDGDGNETISTNFEIPITKNDDQTYTYTYNFDGKWQLNNPKVNSDFIKSLRIYMLPGQGNFKLGDIEFYSNKTIPAPPSDLEATITDAGEIALIWSDDTNAITYNLYRSNSADGIYTKIFTDIKSSEVPFSILPSAQFNYYKISGLNNNGESQLSNVLEVIANITGTETTLSSTISVYPNPSNGRFFIQNKGEEVKRLNIYNASGIEQRINIMNNKTDLIVEIINHLPGIYFIILVQQSQTLIAKVLVQ
jgi:beta-glucanase (GH16 family)